MKEHLIRFIIPGLLILASIVAYESVKGENSLEKDKAIISYNELEQDKKDEFGFNLPVVVFDTKGQKILEDNEIVANMKIYYNEGGLNYMSDKPYIDSDVNMNIRGNTTRFFPKKQYKVELIDENGEERKESLLGMPKESDWVFNAPFADKSLLRNYMVYNVAENIMEYSPMARFCEVFVINDGSDSLKEEHYRGVYLIIEEIKRDENRVNIIKSQQGIDETSFIVNKNKAKEGDIILKNYGSQTYIYDYNLVVKYPKNPTEGQMDYINRTISEFERVLYSDKYDSPREGYIKYIDVDSFVDYYIINEFFKNTDAGIYSTYIYKNKGEKIKAGPIWDFNRAIGNFAASKEDYSELRNVSGFYMAQTSWFSRLLEDKVFIDKVVARYKFLRQTYLNDEYLIEFLDDGIETLGEAIDRNFSLWTFEICNQEDYFKTNSERFLEFNDDPRLLDEYFKNNPQALGTTIDVANNYEEEIKMLKEFIKGRGSWMDKNIENLYKLAK